MSLRDRLKKGSSDSDSGYLQQPAGADNIVPPTDTGVSGTDPNSAQSAFGAAFAAAQNKGAPTAPSMSQPKKGDRFEDVKSRVHAMLVEGLQIAANEALN